MSEHETTMLHCWSVEGKYLSQETMLQHLAVLFEPREQELTTVTVSTPDAATRLSTARAYAFRLAEVWPDAQVYARLALDDPQRLDVMVVGDEWNAEHERSAYRLMFDPEFRSGDPLLDITVWFEENCRPDLTGFVAVS